MPSLHGTDRLYRFARARGVAGDYVHHVVFADEWRARVENIGTARGGRRGVARENLRAGLVEQQHVIRGGSPTVTTAVT